MLQSAVNHTGGTAMQTKTVGGRIKHLRDQRHLTQKALAKQLHVSDKTVASWESDRTEPCISCILEMTMLFHVSLNYLLMGKENHTP